MNEPKIGVTYIGRRESFADNIYGTGLTFAQNQTHPMPRQLAERFLRHPEFEQAKGDVAQQEAAKTDTEEALEAARLEQERKQQEANRLLDLRDSVLQMDKDKVAEFVKVNYNQALAKNMRLENMQAKAQQLIDQFGAP
jgi:hypothetical protein